MARDERAPKQILPAPPGWSLAIHNPDDGGGAVLLPVPFFALLVGEDGAWSVAPLVSAPYDQSGRLRVYAEDDSDVAGLASPGEDSRTWDDIANQLREESERQDRREEVNREAAEIAARAGSGAPGELGAIHHAGLRSLRSRSIGTARETEDDRLFGENQAEVLVALAERGLVACDGHPRAWVLTPLGGEVLRILDNRLR